MIFDWGGLRQHRYFVLNQLSDPLKYCNYAIPIPMSIGLPFMPCDLPNQYELYETDQKYCEEGDIYLIFEENVSFFHRFFLPASHRPWNMVGKDYYHHTPYKATRNMNLCFSSNRPEIKVLYQEKYIGCIRQKTILNCCCLVDNFQQLQVQNANEQVIYRVVSKNVQRGHFLILPYWGFQKIVYQIIQETKNTSLLQETMNSENDDEGKKVGQIVHLFNGLSEYTSKNDKYGITLPEDSNEQQKCLLIHCALMIDYLLFQNF